MPKDSIVWDDPATTERLAPLLKTFDEIREISSAASVQLAP